MPVCPLASDASHAECGAQDLPTATPSGDLGQPPADPVTWSQLVLPRPVSVNQAYQFRRPHRSVPRGKRININKVLGTGPVPDGGRVS